MEYTLSNGRVHESNRIPGNRTHPPSGQPRNPINGSNPRPPPTDAQMPVHTQFPGEAVESSLPVTIGPGRHDDHRFDEQSASGGSTADDDDDDDIDDDADGSNEIPVWVRGEQRWISGLVADTTCAQLVEALLRDDGIIGDDHHPGRTTTTTALLSQYVISEKWRRVEQILDANTKVLGIWTAWGSAKSEVRLTLRKIESAHGYHQHHHHHRQSPPDDDHLYDIDDDADDNKTNPGNDPPNDHIAATTTDQQLAVEHDSGRETPSPTASPSTIRQTLDDASVNRRKQRHQHHHHHRRPYRDKGSSATKPTLRGTNPSSSSKTAKPTIERLMQLILEQGETIQQQLSKLRDREHQILRIEEAKHHSREKEHGKNYLLETYLNGLNEANDGDNNDDGEDEADGNAANRSDSGVHEGTSSPEVGQSASNQGSSGRHPDNIVSSERVDLFDGKYDVHAFKRKPMSQRESKLMQHHKCSKELIETRIPSEGGSAEGSVGDVAEQIEWLQKVISINKHLQREEELVVRLTAKVRKYQSDDPSMSIGQIRDALGTVNTSLESTTTEMARVQNEIAISNEMLDMKETMLAELSAQMEQLDTNNPEHTQLAHPPVEQTTPIPVTSFMHPVPDHTLIVPPIVPMTVPYGEPLFRNTDPMYFEKRDCGIASINMLHLKKNLNLNPSNMKVGPKKWPNGFHKDPDSDTGLSSMGGEDALLQVGTLV